MNYSMNLEKLSLRDYRDILASQTLLPSRTLLHDRLMERFDKLEAFGYQNVASLIKALGNPKTLGSMEDALLTREYLVLLKRELGTLKTKSVPLESFPLISKDQLEQARKRGINTSKECFESVAMIGQELYTLSDLVRINGVGPIAARRFLHAGYGSSLAVSNADGSEMLSRIEQANAKLALYQGRLGQKDMQFCIDFAKLLVTLSE